MPSAGERRNPPQTKTNSPLRLPASPVSLYAGGRYSRAAQLFVHLRGKVAARQVSTTAEETPKAHKRRSHEPSRKNAFADVPPGCFDTKRCW
eukprot:4373693-Alexandrium_andersonii.AAC.1